MSKFVKLGMLFGVTGLITSAVYMVNSVEASENSSVISSRSNSVSTNDVNLINTKGNENSSTKTESTSALNTTVLKQNNAMGQGYYATNKLMARSLLRTDTQAFLDSIRQGSINGWNKYGVLPSTVAAQAILESGWGSSGLSNIANNLFGIKGDYNGSYVTMPTQEYINGQWITINANFRKYPSRNESIEDHGRFLNDNPRYHNLLWQTDYRVVTRLLQEDGYATAPTYAASLNRIIEQYHLYDWDYETVVQKQKTDMVGRVNGGQSLYWLNDSGIIKANATTDSLVGQNVTVTELIKTSANNEYYLANVNGNAVAWIPKSAFIAVEPIIEQENVNLIGQVNSNEPMYWLLDSGMHASGSMTNELANRTVTVTQRVRTSANKEYYLVSVDGRTAAWIPKSAFVVNEPIVERKDVNLIGQVNAGVPTYWALDSGLRTSGTNTDTIAKRTVTVTQWVKTNTNKEYYLVSLDGQAVAWVPKEAFLEDQKVVEHKKVNLTGQVTTNTSMYWALDSGLRASGENTGNIINKDATVTEWVKTSSNQEYYLVSINGQIVAWIPKTAFSENETVVESKDVKLNGRVNGGQSTYWLLNTGMSPSGESTDGLVNQNVTITKWIKTSANKEYYLATVNGQVVAWIPKGAFAESEVIVESKNLTLNGHVNGGQSMYWLLDTGMQASGESTTSLVNKDVTVTKWVKTSANKEYYLVSVAGQTVAWIPKSAFSENETVVQRETVNLAGHVIAGQATYWLLDKGMSASGETTDSLVNQNVVATELIKTNMNREYYLVSVNGQTVAWILKTAFVQ